MLSRDQVRIEHGYTYNHKPSPVLSLQGEELSQHYMRHKDIHRTYRKQLRQNASQAEDLLWHVLRNRTIGFKFRRQHSIQPYIVDFYCAEVSLVIEIDGMTHESDAAQLYDQTRTTYLEQHGYTIVRYGIQQVYEDREAVARDIQHQCNKLLSPMGRD